MPCGISLAPEYFQRKLDQSLEGLNGINKIADDILITGHGASIDEAVKDHVANLLKLSSKIYAVDFLAISEPQLQRSSKKQQQNLSYSPPPNLS